MATRVLLSLLAAFALIVASGCGEDEPQKFGATTLPYPGNAEEVAGISAVLAALEAGEPSPYEEDGGTFQNREGLLPDEPLGHYREYTVPTPGSDDRGARRLVIGAAGETYYTNDHYSSFERIDPEEYQ